MTHTTFAKLVSDAYANVDFPLERREGTEIPNKQLCLTRTRLGSHYWYYREDNVVFTARITREVEGD